MNGSTKRHLGFLAGLGFLVALGVGPAPAGAQASDDGNVVRAEGAVIPGPCADCINHDKQPGDGPGIFTSGHACDVATGQGFGIYFFGNPNSQPVTASVDSLSGTGAVERHYDLTIPAGAGVKKGVPAVGIQVADDDRNGTIHLVGTIAGRPLNQTFSCPCLQPTTTTTTLPTTSSSSPGATTTTLAGTVTSVARSTTPGTLPQTGSTSGDVAFAAVIVLALGAFLLIVGRKSRDI